MQLGFMSNHFLFKLNIRSFGQNSEQQQSKCKDILSSALGLTEEPLTAVGSNQMEALLHSTVDIVQFLLFPCGLWWCDC